MAAINGVVKDINADSVLMMIRTIFVTLITNRPAFLSIEKEQEDFETIYNRMKHDKMDDPPC